jgi:hypothetical protein
MGTNLYRFGLAWNPVNNSKSLENQKKLQLQKLFQITTSSSTIFPGFFSQFLAIFTELFSFQNCFNSDWVCRWVPPVSGTEVSTRPAYQATSPTWAPPVTASSFTREIKRSGISERRSPRSPSPRRCFHRSL